ncbi:circadian clock protein KaiC [Novosphingobium sp. G106]|uniref:circadian clock protein KaiC n=1 Tax=Novosphingobium sp. G106 TaxID=2849500 RepID=UPI001C2D078B|nr:circadian clock protein KaiC [Novosphingobium sp. G106]MBV1688249.1 circadian clock protein KaiC [Novosphingobium sp. G106]
MTIVDVPESASGALLKSPTGIKGLDDLTLGGLPSGRPSLLCGAAGCGKTLFAMTFLVNGATRYGENGVFVSFEERSDDLVDNVASLGFDVGELVEEGRIAIDYVRIEPAEIEVSGEYDLEALFVRLGYAIDKIGAKRVVLDTLEALFSGLTDQAVLRAELRRLFAWIKDKGVTAIITAERGEGQLTRYGIEEYVSDCVILLDNRVLDQVTTRRLRVVKYRGSAHGTNEYPFLIDDRGISVMPITSASLEHQTSSEVVPTGIAGLDKMFGIGGFFRGSSVLISGLAGTGKSTFSAAFANAVCSRGEKCLYFAFEESPAQIVRNMRSAGIDLQRHVDQGLLRFEAARPSLFGLEMHLARMNRDIEEFAPSAIIVDPISAFRGVPSEIHATMLRLVDICKKHGVTAVLTSLSLAADHVSEADRSVSSLMDSWISLTDVEANGERNRVMYVLKSRGMKHSNQIREYLLTDNGITLIEPYIGPNGVLTGAARLAQEGFERAEELERQQLLNQRRRARDRKRETVKRQIAELQASLDAEEEEADLGFSQDDEREGFIQSNRSAMAAKRGVGQ